MKVSERDNGYMPAGRKNVRNLISVIFSIFFTQHDDLSVLVILIQKTQKWRLGSNQSVGVLSFPGGEIEDTFMQHKHVCSIYRIYCTTMYFLHFKIR